MTRILALDLSKRSTGWAEGYGAQAPTTGTVGFDGRTRGHDGGEFQSWLRDKLINYRPHLVVYEAPLFSARAKGSTNTLMVLMGLSYVTEIVCSGRGLVYFSVAVSTWRKAFLGHGFPDDPKAATMNMCQALGWSPQNHDEADACGVWAWAHLNHGDHADMLGQLSRAKVMELAR